MKLCPCVFISISDQTLDFVYDLFDIKFADIHLHRIIGFDKSPDFPGFIPMIPVFLIGDYRIQSNGRIVTLHFQPASLGSHNRVGGQKNLAQSIGEYDRPLIPSFTNVPTLSCNDALQS